METIGLGATDLKPKMFFVNLGIEKKFAENTPS